MLLTDLNPMQREAVQHTEGPLLILAGAGSGKTRVLTYRIALLIEKGVRPWNILAITFTNKAAREMQERVANLVGEGGKDVWVSTFHSCCARILRRDIEKLGYKREFAIYDADDQLSVVKSILKDKGLRDDQYPPKSIRAIISDAKNRLLSPAEWLKESGADFRNQKIAEVYGEYEKKLRGNNALDFDDLLLKTLELLSQNPPVLDYYRNRFQYIHVDEYQDTNMAQYELVRILTGEQRNLCVVGDDDQSIYGWRGADIRNILEFEKDFPDTRVIKLEQNYRSTQSILDAANQVIAHNKGRKEKALWTEEKGGEPILLYDAMDERDEAAYVASQIRAAAARGTSPGEMAVLYRTNAQSRVFEEAFVRSGIKYAVYGGMRFYERKEVKDLIAYMRTLVNPDDDVSTRRIINEPKRSIGDATVDAMAVYAAENDISLMAAAFEIENVAVNKRAQTAVAGFAEMMLELTESMLALSPSAFLAELIDKTGYVRALEANKNEENQNRIENIRELEGAVAEFEKQSPESGIVDFLENVALVTDLENEEGVREHVTLMTIHSAKGLEFDTVFLVGMEENLFPTGRAMFDEEAMEEERRLCYVGITRARKNLYLTHARSRMLYNMRKADALSRFASEIPERLIKHANARAMSRLPRPESRSYGRDDYAAPARRERAFPEPKRDYAPAAPSGIAGVQKGVSGPKVVPSQARSIAAVSLFQVGDAVMHRTFGRGRVVEVIGSGNQQVLKIDFGQRGIKQLAAAVAPIVRIKG